MPKSDFLFKEFSSVSAKEWIQQIQMELQGADYNTLVWESLEGIKVKPFYHSDHFEYLPVPTPEKDYKIGQDIYIDDPEIANKITLSSLAKGADIVRFTATQSFDMDVLFQGISATAKTPYLFFQNHFFSPQFTENLLEYFKENRLVVQQDVIGHLARTGKWFQSEKIDFSELHQLVQKYPQKAFVGVDASLYQNAGANIVQQVSYALAHTNEYLNRLGEKTRFQVEFSMGSNYFFEIAKLRAFRYLWQLLAQEYGWKTTPQIIAKPTLRSKTLYDYNVNLLRTATEYMSAALGGADVVITQPYDRLFKKSNEFSERIARNQLLLLREENGFQNAPEYIKGSYYIEALTIEIAKKALRLFKEIEKSGGFLKQLLQGVIQRKIQLAAEKEQQLFDKGKIVLVGTNKYSNSEDRMKNEIEIYPFVKFNKKQTLIPAILPKRLAEKQEKKRLAKEGGFKI